MKLINLFITVFVIMFLVSVGTQAHPVTYKGGTLYESENNSNGADVKLGYTFHPKWAILGQYMNEVDTKTEYQFVRLNHRLYRQNNIDSQFNIYLGAGHGYEKMLDQKTAASLYEIDTDWEDRDYYAAASYMLIDRKNNQDEKSYKVRAGLAPYRGEFDSLNLWFITEFKKQEYQNWETTPLIRMFYKTVLTEFGISLNGESQFRLMFHL